MKRFVFIGRPNVGKSSLFNALLGYRRSIVFDEPGTTLDFVSEVPKWGEGKLRLEDSQGIFDEGDEAVVAKILERADFCLFVVDAQVGVTPFDRWVSTLIAKSKKPSVLLINKSEGMGPSAGDEFFELGYETAIAVSAAHRQGLDSVREWCLRHAGEGQVVLDDEPVTVALMGRPNAGKSSLMNKLCRETVSRVSPQPLTTRDMVSFELETRLGKLRLLDTAGMRRPRADKTPIEEFSIAASTRALKECDVALLLIDASQAISDQDMRLLSLLERQGKPCVVLLNFWDKLRDEARRNYVKESDFRDFIGRFKTLPISAKTGWNLPKLLPLIFSLAERAGTRVKTSELNRFVQAVISKNPPPAAGQGNFNILYASQVKVSPPTFVFFMNRKGNLPDSYARYLENQIKNRLGFRGQPVRVFFKAGERR